MPSRIARYRCAPILFSGLAIGGAALLAGCPSGAAPQKETVKTGSSRANPAVASVPGGKVKVEDGSGKTLFVLDPSNKGFHVKNDAGAKLGEVKVETDRVKVANAAGQPAFKVKEKDGGFKLYRDSGGGADAELADFEAKGGGFRINDAAGKQLYRGKPDGAKTKVSGPGGKVYKIKTKDDGLEVEDAGGKRVVRIKGLAGAAGPVAASFCAGPEWDPLQKAAVIAYSVRIGR